MSSTVGRDNIKQCSTTEGLQVEGGFETGRAAWEGEACADVDVAEPISTFNPYVTFESITEFFTRPVILSSGSLPTTRTNIVSVALSPYGIFNLWGTGGTGRVANAALAHFRPVFTLQVGVTPFAQGLLCLSYQPEGAYPTTVLRNARSATCTNIPNVLLDVSEQTSVTLRLPFMFYNDSVDIMSTTTIGTVGINAVLPVAFGSSTTPTYKLYFHLEDLRLSGVRPASFLQSVYPPVTTQSGLEQQAAQGPISGPLKKAGGVATALGAFSSLRPFAQPLSWFTAAAAKSAFAFGFSKPLIQNPNAVMVTATHNHQYAVDMPSTGATLGIFNDNRVRVDETLGYTQTDEMDLKWLVSQYGQMYVGKIATTDAVGTSVMTGPASPSVCFTDRTSTGNLFYSRFAREAATGATVGYIPTHLAYWSGYFKFWRGSLKYRFTFAKTKLHGGRVIAEFIPHAGADGAYLYTPSPPAPTGFTKIFDLRDGNSFEFVVPYMADRPWSHTMGNNFGSALGTLSLRVLDPLVTSTMTSSTITFLVEVAAGDDYELASYASPPFTTRGLVTVKENSALGGSSGYTHAISQTSTGEAIRSVKQLLMIPSQRYLSNTTAGSTKRHSMPPWWYINPIGFNEDSHFDSVSASVAQLYAFARGKSSYTINGVPAAGTSYSLITEQETMKEAPTSMYDPQYYTNNQGFLSCVVPHYPTGVRFSPRCFQNATITKTSSTFNVPPGVARSSVYPWSEPTTWASLRITNPAGVTGNVVTTTVAAADDAGVAGYLGPIPMVPHHMIVNTVVPLLASTPTVNEQSDLEPPYLDFGAIIVKPELRPIPETGSFTCTNINDVYASGTSWRVNTYRVGYGPFNGIPPRTTVIATDTTDIVWRQPRIQFTSELVNMTPTYRLSAYVRVIFTDDVNTVPRFITGQTGTVEVVVPFAHTSSAATIFSGAFPDDVTVVTYNDVVTPGDTSPIQIP
ncbi:hypothetical protein 2 [Trichosanthes kirilowii dicistrovirus]|nr:hypothetical protein 2 [Trichosanthes kirilowii dicistrovirus]